MNKFEKRMQEIRQEAKDNSVNINIGIMALNAIFEELTPEQQKAQAEKFIMVLENLL